MMRGGKRVAYTRRIEMYKTFWETWRKEPTWKI